MEKIAYLNGSFMAHKEAKVHIEDRGYQLADGVYEVVLSFNKTLVDAKEHWKRLMRSLQSLKIAHSFQEKDLQDIARRLLEKNQLPTASLYLQITRGVFPRTQGIPEKYSPSILMTCAALSSSLDALPQQRGDFAITHPDIRWKMRTTKALCLTASTLLKQKALDQGAYEAILFEDDQSITEGTYTNVFIVDSKGVLLTRKLDGCILEGVTRKRLLHLAQQAKLDVQERAFSLSELYGAREVFVTSTTSIVRPIVSIDGHRIADGKVGKVSLKLIDLYRSFLDFLVELDGH